MYKRALKLIEELMNDDLPEEKAKKKYDELIRLKVLQNLYQNRYTEVIEEVNKCKTHEDKKQSLSLLKGRVKQKLDSFIETKNTNNKTVWHETAEKNFHKSLDHRSFYFNKGEKKMSTQSRKEKT